MAKLKQRMGWGLLLAVLALLSGLMLRITARYTAFRDDVAFLLIKQDYVDIGVWKAAFYVHVFSAVLLLFAGFTQFSRRLRAWSPRWHRRLGMAYIGVLLGLAAPSGMVLAIYANGGILAKVAFVLLTTLWIGFTWLAWLTARRREFAKHRIWMVLSYALTLSALTLRTWKFALVRLPVHLTPKEMYQLIAWLGFVPNLAVALAWLRLSARRGE